MNINKLTNFYSLKSEKVMLKAVLFCLLLLSTSMVKADDTEVFYTSGLINNNVMFIMDNSGSMSEPVAGTVSSSEDRTTISRTISHVNDDAEEFVTGDNNNKNTYTYSSDLGLNYDRRTDFGNGGGNADKEEQLTGLRFEKIEVPEGATITSSYIHFTADEDSLDISAEDASLNIRIQEHDDGARFNNGQFKDIANRNWSSNTITWTPPAWNIPFEKSEAQKTPDLKELVQLVINRGGWVEGNALVFVFSGNSYRSARSRDQGEDDAPVLIVEYQLKGEKTRMRVMKDALKTVLDSAPDNLNVGLMNYGDHDTTLWRNQNYTNGVKFPVTSVSSLARPIVEESMTVGGSVQWHNSNIPEPNDTVTVRAFLSEIVEEWEPQGMTPIVDALYEASQYFRGAPVDWGHDRAEKRRNWGAHPSTYEGLPTVDAWTNDNCGTTRIQTVYNGSIAQWDAGTSGFCPGNISSPSGTGSSANCPNTKIAGSCETYNSCLKRTDTVTTCADTDENGKGINCTTTGGVCTQWGTGNRCDYTACGSIWTEETPPNYTTPMQDGCQSSFMILMSDGKPEYSGNNGTNTDPKSYWDIKTILGENGDSDDCPIAEYQSGRCGPQLTDHLATNDNSDINGDQFIHTYVIGFAEGIDAEATSYLQSLVTLEDNEDTDRKEGYFSATNEAELAEAFAQALDEIAQEARSQASPGYSVNVKSGLEHEDDIYIPVFDKRSSSVWSGNLKKFKLVDTGTKRKIRGKADVTGDNPATYIDAMTELGLFKEDAWDLFSKSPIPDGNVVEYGGTAGLLNDQHDDPSNVIPRRKLYSNISGANLSDAANHIVPGNAAITSGSEFLNYDETELGLDTAEAIFYRKKVINFIRGWKGGVKNTTAPYGEQRHHMGDMLHSEPVIITYQQGNDSGVGKDQYIFAATNEGYLHVFNSSTGEEVFAFMPKELLKNIQPQFTGQGPHLYGIDGSISYWHDDKDDNGNVDGADKVYVFFGMRRGGNSYYALDVTNVNAPKFMWVADNNDSGLDRLGQSWSMPYLTRIKHNGVKKEVVVVTAGNDPHLDYAEEGYDLSVDRTATTMADDIFILDLGTGTKLWSLRDSVSQTVMHGLPGGVRILDVNRNGLLDRMYFADTGGNVWRLDMSETLSTDPDDYNLTKFASLGGSRKFYNEPDVAQLRANGKTKFSISVGSGHRPHPMDETITDHMFVLLDDSPLDPLPDDYQKITTSDLELVSISATQNGTGQTAGPIIKTITKSSDFEDKNITDVVDSNGNRKRGWYLGFSELGEKVLAQSITFEGSLIFTTLVPEVLTQGELINSCAAPPTQGRIYALDILSGEASMNLDENEVIDDNDAFLTISASEIPGTPQRVFNKLKCPAGEKCTHEVDVRIGKKATQVSGGDVAEIESIYWSDPSN